MNISKNCRRRPFNGKSKKGMSRTFKTKCSKNYAVKWAQERHDRMFHGSFDE